MCLRQFMEHLASITTLQYLDVSMCEGLSAAGLTHISRLPRLQTLRLQHCHNIVQYKVTTCLKDADCLIRWSSYTKHDSCFPFDPAYPGGLLEHDMQHALLPCLAWSYTPSALPAHSPALRKE